MLPASLTITWLMAVVVCRIWVFFAMVFFRLFNFLQVEVKGENLQPLLSGFIIGSEATFVKL